MSLLVRVTPEAETQIREIDSWWRENRLAVPDLFLSDLPNHSTLFRCTADRALVPTIACPKCATFAT